jgi:hypothetical protein
VIRHNLYRDQCFFFRLAYYLHRDSYGTSYWTMKFYSSHPLLPCISERSMGETTAWCYCFSRRSCGLAIFRNWPKVGNQYSALWIPSKFDPFYSRAPRFSWCCSLRPRISYSRCSYRWWISLEIGNFRDWGRYSYTLAQDCWLWKFWWHDYSG